jgi:hypothetical protein
MDLPYDVLAIVKMTLVVMFIVFCALAALVIFTALIGYLGGILGAGIDRASDWFQGGQGGKRGLK